MEEVRTGNYAMLRGVLHSPPRFSHQSREERFYRFSLDVSRLSGTVDTIQVIARSGLLEALEPGGGSKLCVAGEMRSFNNKSGVGPRLVITVFARELWFDDGEDENVVELRGALCKPPNLRVTPLGREICDLMLAVRRRLPALHRLGELRPRRRALGRGRRGMAHRAHPEPGVSQNRKRRDRREDRL